MADVARSYTNVTVRTKNDVIRKEWETTVSYKKNINFAGFLEKEVMARQILNVELAIRQCLIMNIDWIIHIDCDELFVVNRGTLDDHFQVTWSSFRI